jgi:hypothetical protein
MSPSTLYAMLWRLSCARYPYTKSSWSSCEGFSCAFADVWCAVGGASAARQGWRLRNPPSVARSTLPSAGRGRRTYRSFSSASTSLSMPSSANVSSAPSSKSSP